MILKTASAGDVARMLDWASKEGWNPGHEDAEAFYASDPEGFFLAEVDGRMVAAISVVIHSDSFAFLGLYICHPQFRGQGIGLALWRHALAHAGDRTVGLDGVAEQQANYARSGFRHAGATMRYRGRLKPLAHPDIRALDARDDLSELDLAANGFARPRFLRPWLTQAETRKTVVLQRGKVAGFATARLCRDGGKLGPVVAETAADAWALMQAAALSVGVADVTIDVPGAQAGFQARLEVAGFRSGFATA